MYQKIAKNGEKMYKNEKKHAKDYKPKAYKQYTTEELSWWVVLLTKRSTHRAAPKKAEKDAYDAMNYASMLQEAYAHARLNK